MHYSNDFKALGTLQFHESREKDQVRKDIKYHERRSILLFKNIKKYPLIVDRLFLGPKKSWMIIKLIKLKNL